MSQTRGDADLVRSGETLPVRVKDDPDFELIGFKADLGLWLGRTRVGSNPVDVTVVADSKGPTDRQRQLWRVLLPKLEGLSTDVAAGLAAEAERTQPGQAPQAAEFTLKAVRLTPESCLPQVDLVLSYALEWDDDATWRAELRGFTLVTIARG